MFYSTRNALYSVWNATRDAWATSTNYSTEEEASALVRCIRKQCKDAYEVRARKFGTIGE